DDLDPDRTGGGVDDAGQYRQAVMVAQVQGDADELGIEPPPAEQDQGADVEAGPQDLDQRIDGKPDDGQRPRDPHRRRAQGCDQPGNRDRQQRSQEQVCRLNALIEHQPQHQQEGRHQRGRQPALHGSSPVASTTPGTGVMDITRSIYWVGSCSAAEVRSRYPLTGPASTVMEMHSSSRMDTGMASVSCRRGAVASTDQKVRTPNRISEMIAARPDRMISVSIVQASGPAVYRLPMNRPAGLSRAWNRLNLATKPDSGGSPAMIRAQATKNRPRNAMAAGMMTPADSSGSLSMAKASMVRASIAALGLRIRSINSISNTKAATARVELSR